jgi:hypothetical protein
MQRALARNIVVTAALFAGAFALVLLEVLVLARPPSGAWFFVMVVAALGGFLWANLQAFPGLAQPMQALVGASIGVALWLVVVLVVVVAGVGLKFALGGRL